MNRKLFVSVLCLSAMFTLSACLENSDDRQKTDIEKLSFPDKNLKTCINRIAKEEGWKKPEHVTKISCYRANIEDIAGIDQFINLKELDLMFNNIGYIADYQFPASIEKIYLFRNNLKNPIFFDGSSDSLPSLKTIDISEEMYEHIYLANLKSLESLIFNGELSDNGDLTLLNLPNLDFVHPPWVRSSASSAELLLANLPKLRSRRSD